MSHHSIDFGFHTPQRGLLFLLLGACLFVLSGCGFSSWGLRPQWSALMNRPAKISPEASKEDMLAVVNQSIEPIHAWRTTTARVNISGVPVPLKAMIAVQQPNYMRFTVSGGLSGQSELDLGSNKMGTWVWAREMEPKAILTVSHEDMDQLQHQLPIPIQPEWMMEVLGVKPIQGEQAELIRNPDQPYRAKLVSHHENAGGQTFRKIITIDLRKGEVRKHELYDAQHRLVVSAELNHYQKFPKTEARLPQQVTFYWPDQGRKIHLTLHGLEVNPPHMPQTMWDIPQIAGCPVRQLHCDQIAGIPQAGQHRAVRGKPKAITEYNLHQKSGAWVQNQYIQRTGAEDTTGKVQLSSQSPGVTNESPYFQPGDTLPQLQERTASSPDPPPFPDAPNHTADAADPEEHSLPEWARPAQQESPAKRSRDELIIQ